MADASSNISILFIDVSKRRKQLDTASALLNFFLLLYDFY